VSWLALVELEVTGVLPSPCCCGRGCNGGHGAAASLVATAVQLRRGTVERGIHHLAMYH
jgi:hypothetical protein